MHQSSIARNLLLCVTSIDFLCLAMVATIFPSLVFDIEYGLVPSTWTDSERFIMIGCLMGAYPLGQFISAPYWGRISDRRGRKNILIITLLGTAGSCIISALACFFSLCSLLLGSRLMAGIFAGNIAIAQASLSDISPSPEQKSANMSLMQMTMGLGWLVGPSAAGFFVSIFPSVAIGYTTLFALVSLMITGIAILFIRYFNSPLRSADTTTLDASSEIGGNRALMILFFVWTLFVCGWMFYEQFIPTFLQEKWKLDPLHIGYSVSFFALTYSASNFLIFKRSYRYIKSSTQAFVSLFLGGCSLIVMAYSSSYYIFMSAGFFFLFFLAGAASSLMTIISDTAHDSIQGRVFGYVSSIQSISTIVFSFAGGIIMSHDIKSSHLYSGILIIVSSLIFLLYIVRGHNAK